MPKLPEPEAVAKAKAGRTRGKRRFQTGHSSLGLAPCSRKPATCWFSPQTETTARRSVSLSWPRRDRPSVFSPRQQIRRHQLRPQGLGAADCLPEAARAYAFAEGSFHRIDLVRWAISLHGGVFGGINERFRSRLPRPDQSRPRQAPRKSSPTLARLALLAEICSGRRSSPGE